MPKPRRPSGAGLPVMSRDSFIQSVWRRQDRQGNHKSSGRARRRRLKTGVLNYIWLALVLLAVAIGGWNDRLKDVTGGALDGAKTAVTIALGLWGIMALWLGVMRLAERAGLVQRIAYGLRPLMQRLFPEGSPAHPAMGSMVMNMAANMLGLGNAATRSEERRVGKECRSRWSPYH